MQVIYSGGSGTPSPSPRAPRKKYGYGQPFMPGYTAGGCGHPFAPTKRRVIKVQRQLTDGDVGLRDSIPAMTKPVAITCLICNILVPGLGTCVSGFTIFCGSQIRLPGKSRSEIVKTNCGVALLQFFTAFLFLLGWIWSIMWGVTFLNLSEEYRRQQSLEAHRSHERTHKLSEQPASHQHRRLTTPNNKADAQAQAQSQVTSHPRSSNRTGPSSHASTGPPHRTPTPASALASSSSSSCHTTGYENRPSAPTALNTDTIITLQEAPVILPPENDKKRTEQIINCVNPRHQRIIRRRISDQEFSPVLLTNEGLEQIIVHDLPVPNGNHSMHDVARLDDTSKEGPSGVS